MLMKLWMNVLPCSARRKAEWRGEAAISTLAGAGLGTGRGSGELVLVGDCWRHGAVTQTPVRDLT